MKRLVGWTLVLTMAAVGLLLPNLVLRAAPAPPAVTWQHWSVGDALYPQTGKSILATTLDLVSSQGWTVFTVMPIVVNGSVRFDIVAFSGGSQPVPTPTPTASPTPTTPPVTGCVGPDPFASIPNMYGVCVNGGWQPRIR